MGASDNNRYVPVDSLMQSGVRLDLIGWPGWDSPPVNFSTGPKFFIPPRGVGNNNKAPNPTAGCKKAFKTNIQTNNGWI